MRSLTINLDAISHNLAVFRKQCPGVKICGVVKANAYGHGMIPVAHHLQAQGVDYLGVADIDEALQLRGAGITIPVLAWLHNYDEDFVAAVEGNVDLGVSTTGQLDAAALAATNLGMLARIHLKVDTGLGRNGATMTEWADLVAHAKQHAQAGNIVLVGIFSHLSSTSVTDDLAQIANFDAAVAQAAAADITPELRHLTASDGSLSYPQAHYEMVRIGVSLYGLSPFTDHTSADYGLVPAMTATARVVQVKTVEAGQGVSYGYQYRTTARTKLALVPVGYAEGLPRLSSGSASVVIKGKSYVIAARIAMDQFVIDVGNDDIEPGDIVVLFGDPALGVPAADDLAAAASTINYEIVTRMGGRFVRQYVGQGAQE